MAGVVLSPIEAAQDGALSKAADSLKKAETTTTRPDAPDEILVRRDVPTGAELSRVEQSVQVVLPASAAESLWRGAALARLAGSEDETNDHRDMALPQASSPLADDRAKLVAVGGVDKVVPQVATTTSSVEGVVPGSGSAKVSRREVDPAPSGSGHVVAQSGGASGGPGLQRPQAAIAGTLSVLPPDPTLPVEDEALTDPDLSLSVGFASGSATSVPFSVVGTSVMPHLPATVGHLAGQIAAVVAQTKGGLTEIALSPEELGRVQMTLQADARQPDRMVIFLSFDRPETLELFRRHGDQLAEAMRMAGYSGADISFGQSGTNAGGNSGADPGQAGSAQGNGSLQPLAQSASRTSDTAIGRGDLNAPKHGAGSALDLRL
ncbi:MAG: flagellar hook-length control protein FliK [Rhodobacterales bacterium]|nr:flagellar hook-length control protein FliK [Rhodobacterales bacterium]